MQEWRKKVLKKSDVALIALEFVLSVIFVLIGYSTGSVYFRGVGVGLIIAWVTSAIAHLYSKHAK